MTITMLGAGSWGTALALLLAGKGYIVHLWTHDTDHARRLSRERENRQYLPGYLFPHEILITNDMRDAAAKADAVVFAVPSGAVREVAASLAAAAAVPSLIINAGKGLESETGLRLSQVLCEELPSEVCRRLVVISGPNLAVELAKKIPTATVAASEDEESAVLAQDMFTTPSFRVYRNPDVTGVELGGALKNVLAIGAGISDGLGFGDNTKAVLVTRGLLEMMRLASTLGADPRTMTGLAGVGDLMATSASSLSRNLRLGRAIGGGKTVDAALALVQQVAEGMPTCKAAYGLSQKLTVYMPITEQIYKVLFESKDPRQAVADLMVREPKEEYD